MYLIIAVRYSSLESRLLPIRRRASSDSLRFSPGPHHLQNVLERSAPHLPSIAANDDRPRHDHPRSACFWRHVRGIGGSCCASDHRTTSRPIRFIHSHWSRSGPLGLKATDGGGGPHIYGQPFCLGIFSKLPFPLGYPVRLGPRPKHRDD